MLEYSIILHSTWIWRTLSWTPKTNQNGALRHYLVEFLVFNLTYLKKKWFSLRDKPCNLAECQSRLSLKLNFLSKNKVWIPLVECSLYLLLFFDFDCSPLATSLTFNALFVVVVVKADVVVVGVFVSCAVTLVAVLVLGLFSWLIVDFMLSPRGLPCTFWHRSISAKNGGEGD